MDTLSRYVASIHSTLLSSTATGPNPYYLYDASYEEFWGRTQCNGGSEPGDHQRLSGSRSVRLKRRGFMIRIREVIIPRMLR